MLTPPTAPSPGKPVSAGFFARFIAWVKSGQLVEGPGYRLRRTPNGTSLVIPQAKSAENKTEDKGCFKIEKIDSEDKTVKLVNCYFNVGGNTIFEDDMVSPVCEIKDEIVCLCLGIPQGARYEGCYLEWYKKDDLALEQSNVSNYVIPLYAFEVSEVEEYGATSAGGSEDKKYMFNLICDMRNAPCPQMQEYP